MNDERVGVGLKLKAHLKKKLDTAAAERDVYSYEVLEEALEGYFKKTESEPAWITPQNRPYLKKLADILATADEKTEAGVSVVLDGLLRRARETRK